MRQVHPVEEAGDTVGTVMAEARAHWSFDEGRLIAYAAPAESTPLPEIVRARYAEGKVADSVAYMRKLATAARQDSSAIGVLELSVKQWSLNTPKHANHR